METALPSTTPIPHRAQPVTGFDHYENRKASVITVRMVPALKRRIDERVRREIGSGHQVSMNELCLAGITAYLDLLDQVDADQTGEAREERC